MECFGTVAFSKLPIITRGIAIIKRCGLHGLNALLLVYEKEGRWEPVFMCCCIDIKDAEHTVYVDEVMGERKRDGKGLKEGW